nr:hypothetical protein [Candidatus Gracilibacteria bacterium]
MQYFFLFILSIPFLFINYKIVISDLKNKIIPNKFLLYLIFILPFYYLYTFFYFDVNYLFFFGQIILAIFISFILYYFGIWSAGDAKYLLVLALFIPHIGIVTFVGNIALLTLIYLFCYFVWFYIGRCLFNWKYTKSLYKNIYNELKDKFLIFIKNNDGNIYGNDVIKKIIKWIILFLIIYISFRLFRIYLFNDIFGNNNGVSNIKILQALIEKYHFYIVILVLVIILGLIYLFRIFLAKLKIYIKNLFDNKFNITSEIIDFIFLGILSFSLLSFIIFEFLNNPIEIKNDLIKIFTIYLGLYLLTKFLIYSYKITFSVSETYYIDIKELKEGDIVDKEYLEKMFGEQSSLGAHGHIGILSPNPSTFFQYIKNPIDEEIKDKLIEIYSIVNNYHKKDNSKYTKNTKIKILKTFAFGGYLFLGFIITYLFGNKLFTDIINFFIDLIKIIYNN